MGDVSVVARRKTDGTVEFGWSGNWGGYRTVGAKLMQWYNSSFMVDYLFAQGQLSNLGAPLTERRKKIPDYLSTCPTGQPHWTAKTELATLSKIAFVDFIYFFDLDEHWYYIRPWPVRIKIPLELIASHLDHERSEWDYLRQIEQMVAEQILLETPKQDPEFAALLAKAIPDDDEINKIVEEEYPLTRLVNEWPRSVLSYFDNWIIIVPDQAYAEAAGLLLSKATQTHVETIDRPGHPKNAPAPYINPYISGYQDGYIIGRLKVYLHTQCLIEDKDSVLWRNGKVDIEGIKREVDPTRIAPEWFIDIIRDVIDDEKAFDVIDEYKDKLLEEGEKYSFGTRLEEGRKFGEANFKKKMKEGNAIWLKQRL